MCIHIHLYNLNKQIINKKKNVSMREIKFRGKSKLNNEWLFGDLLRLGGNRTPCIFSDKDSIRDFNAHNGVVIPETTGQFTGLKDKNGIDIYEGDIIKDYDNTLDTGIIEFCCGSFGVYATPPILFYSLSDIDEEFLNNLEVIGNIHDNPELLNNLNQ